MSAKQDRQGARTVSDLERRYNFGTQFAEILGIATDAQTAAQIAYETAINLDNDLTADEIFNRLTGNSKEQGIYRENGKVYVNANFIKTGFISSDLIKAGVIRSLDYEAIEVDEIYPANDLYPGVLLFPNNGGVITKGMEIDFAAGVIRVGGESGALAAYPVGSFYLSAIATSPAELFGGTWERLKDTFLMASGNKYTAGSTGGKANHAHKYGLQYGGYYGDIALENDPNAGSLVYDANGNISVATAEKLSGFSADVNGGSTKTRQTVTPTHYRSIGTTSTEDNLPPYLAVYVWKRVA